MVESSKLYMVITAKPDEAVAELRLPAERLKPTEPVHDFQATMPEELNDDKSSQFQRQIKLLFGGGSDAIAGQLFLCKLPVHLHGPCTLPGSAVDGMGRAG
ncbi:hypothetical protein T4C_10570 [Trichinella pseudospiralis]|uniref:Uncharacterized protein n=1 Tax=Trichinella pseudospiralis TaxID=6337 RepID=A0A0V1IVM9_TRIPS|nr:hypothetical protein T4C_10570 [Trichinella pseudospiralis]